MKQKNLYKVQLDDIMGKADFIDILPQNISKSRSIGFTMENESSGHMIGIDILDKNNCIKYRIFDPKYGETKKLSIEEFKKTLYELVTKKYSNLDEYNLTDNNIVVSENNLTSNGRRKYPKARLIRHKNVNLDIKAVCLLLERGAKFSSSDGWSFF